MILVRLARTFKRDESGMALVMVISIGSVLTLLVVAAVAMALGGMRSARNDQDWSGALAAAFAGVEEYQSRLAADPNYARYGNPAASLSHESGSLVTLPAAALTNPAFAVVTGGAWAAVPGSELTPASVAPASPVTVTPAVPTGAATAAPPTAGFRYEVDNSKFGSTGTVSLRSTGRVGGETRTVLAQLRVNSFLDYLYFTDFEIADPTPYGAAAVTNCTRYAYNSRPTGSGTNNCHEIAFGTSDVLNGPVHSNDTIRACKTTFNGPVTTAFAPPAPGALLYSRMTSAGANCDASTFIPGFPLSREPVVMPVTNTALKLETHSDLAVEPGCLYTGPTRIVFNGGGTVTVHSPWTRQTRVTGTPVTAGTHPAACGAPGASGLGSAAGATFTVPDSTVMYVQDVPAVTTDPNYPVGGANPTITNAAGVGHQLTCTGAGGNGTSTGNGIGYPILDEIAPAGTNAYDCSAGDAFVEGTLKGAVTVATSRFLYVTGNILYKDTSRDVLGLVGDGAVIVSNPVDSGNRSLLVGASRTIHAAILSVQHTFQVQNVAEGGPRGTLTIRGAIAQKFRGIVYSATGSGSSLDANGYTKDYRYDNRFSYLTPPKFLQPVSTTYGVTAWIEVGTAYSAAGAAT